MPNDLVTPDASPDLATAAPIDAVTGPDGRPSLDALARRFNTDKAARYLTREGKEIAGHDYAAFYERFGEAYRVDAFVEDEDRDHRRGAHHLVDRHASVSIIASITDAPSSANGALWRMNANSSRPVPTGGGGGAPGTPCSPPS